MIIDGKKIAEDVYERVRERVVKLGRAPRFAVITCNPNFETQKYLALKQKKALQMGIETDVTTLDAQSATEDFVSCIEKVVKHSDAIIIQLPLPTHVDRERVMRAIPSSHDADALNPDTQHILSPVVSACREILGVHEVVIPEKFVTVVGSGQLVGLPLYHWFVSQGAHVSVVTKDTHDISNYTRQADIVVCGAGVPGLLTPHMVREGVVILDAGTSEESGELRGDALAECAVKASIFTPVPGGIGPITVAMLLKNVVDCVEARGTVV
jgi:methylenetetrahydrofolate dehydrogenase (NADP+)/methenyltetrahydrofolate cyclohydrolase